MSGRFSTYAFCLLTFLILGCQDKIKQFTEMTPEETGLSFVNKVNETQHNNILTFEYSYNGAGIAAGDVNNDGLTDLYFCGNSVSNKLYLNKGNWKFDDVTQVSKTSGRVEDWKTGVTMVDINADGFLDIYVCYSGNAPGEGYNRPVIKDHPKRSNQLFINNGCKPGEVPTFTDRAKEYGLDAPGTFSTQAYFFDYDVDGDLDMFLLNHANMFYAAFLNTKRLRNLRHPYFGNKLYRNDIGVDSTTSVFTEVSAEAGIHGSGLNFGLSAAISDLNFDGYPDIYVTNDYEEQDFCYINNRDGTFKEQSRKLFGHLSKFGMGSDIADINNDGLQDLLVLDMLPEDNERQKLLKGPDDYDKYVLAVDSGYHHQYMRNTLQINRGFAGDSLPTFSEIGQLAGISNTDWSWTPFLVDLDNDGLRDIFITNGFLRDFTNLDFMKYTSDVYAKARSSNQGIDYLKIIQQLPQTKLANYIFHNDGGARFHNASVDWGLTSKTVSNGSIYADLDNDGDYDLVTNNLEDQATVLRNNSDLLQQSNYLKIQLVGPKYNKQGIGSIVTIESDTIKVLSEAYYTRGYCSSVEPIMTIGLGKTAKINNVTVTWPDGSVSTQRDVAPNTKLLLRHGEKNEDSQKKLAEQNEMILTDVTDNSGLNYLHQENDFIDFKTQRLLYYQLSRLGGKISVGDVNGDGNDDLFLENAAGQSAKLYIGSDDGYFRLSDQQPWEQDSSFEDNGSTFFDADQDGDLDLYVVSGGSEFAASSGLYQDRLYINDGKGNFVKNLDALPDESTSGSCVSAADYDKDGDLDLFVGGRHSPQSYGIVPRSYILENITSKDKIQFRDVTGKINTDVANPGMVTEAMWTDFNNDSWPDLILVGEWMPIRVFQNNKGTLVEQQHPNLAKSNGWWCSISSADVDGDGDLDFVLGNAGENLQFKPSILEPVELFVSDFNNDGVTDPVLSYYIQGKSYPLATRDELLDQITPLRKKFIKYADYSKATVQDFADATVVEKAYKLNAYNLKSSWMENLGGEGFKIHELPYEAQFSSVNGALFDDFDGDGANDILLAGNFYPYKPQLGRCDASTGLLLNFADKQLESKSPVRSNVLLTGDIRDMAIVKSKNLRQVVVSRNNDKCSVYRLTSDLNNVKHKLP